MEQIEAKMKILQVGSIKMLQCLYICDFIIA